MQELKSMPLCLLGVFGTLPGWWGYTDEHLRNEGPTLNLAGWDAVLKVQNTHLISFHA